MNAKTGRILGYFAAGTTKRTSTIVDMQGFDEVWFLADLGTILENGTIDVFVEQNTVNSASGMARLATTTAHTVTAANALLTESQIVVKINRPTERYLQCNITPAVSNAVVLGITVIQFGGRVQPATDAASVLKSTTLASPAEA